MEKKLREVQVRVKKTTNTNTSMEKVYENAPLCFKRTCTGLRMQPILHSLWVEPHQVRTNGHTFRRLYTRALKITYIYCIFQSTVVKEVVYALALLKKYGHKQNFIFQFFKNLFLKKHYWVRPINTKHCYINKLREYLVQMFLNYFRTSVRSTSCQSTSNIWNGQTQIRDKLHHPRKCQWEFGGNQNRTLY